VIHPPFMDDFETFDAERRRVATLAEVKAFQNKWFPKEGWAECQKPGEWAEVSNHARRNRDLAEAATGRNWAPKMISYALEPVARYEYGKTLALFREILFPQSNDGPRKLGRSLWHLSCDYCLISTWTEGDIYCPLCRRELVCIWLGE
jgi:hypothetical protein